MIEAPIHGPIRADYIPEAYQKLQHAVEHDLMDEAIIEALNDPDDFLEMSRDLKGTRRIIFSLMLDLGLVNTKYPINHKSDGEGFQVVRSPNSRTIV